jgi:hypothetical protein
VNTINCLSPAALAQAPFATAGAPGASTASAHKGEPAVVQAAKASSGNRALGGNPQTSGMGQDVAEAALNIFDVLLSNESRPVP